MTTTDTDLDILSSLTLSDLQSICQTNQYYYRLYQDYKNRLNIVKLKVDKILQYINLNKEFNLQLSQGYDHNFIQLFLDRMRYDSNIIIEDDNDKLFSFNIRMHGKYDVTEYKCYFATFGRFSKAYLYVTLLELKKLLIHLFYDNMIFTY